MSSKWVWNNLFWFMNDLQLTSIFCIVDDFCKGCLLEFEKRLIGDGGRKRTDCLSISEIMMILLWFNMSGMNCFKHFYFNSFHTLKMYFPKIPSYNRFLSVQKKAFIPMIFFLKYLVSFSKKTGIYYIDSTFLQVCKNQRIYKHKVCKGLAERGMSSTGWFFGFKWHIICNNFGEIVSFKITKGNTSDISQVQDLTSNLEGFLFGDKGYLSKNLEESLLKRGLNIITKCRKNMKEKSISKTNKYLLYRRGIIETIFGKMKDFGHLVHTKYRSITGFFLNILSSVICYQCNPKKPSVNVNRLGC